MSVEIYMELCEHASSGLFFAEIRELETDALLLRGDDHVSRIEAGREGRRIVREMRADARLHLFED